jgi:citrate lyase beta subunit
MTMRHFSYVDDKRASRLFHKLPSPISIDSPPEHVAAALGATLYSPGTRPTLAKDVVKQAKHGCLSMVLCLEDSVPDDAVEFAETNVAEAMQQLAAKSSGSKRPVLPLLFIRVRTPEQLERVAGLLGPGLDLLSGFVIPKYATGWRTASSKRSVACSATTGRTGRTARVGSGSCRSSSRRG